MGEGVVRKSEVHLDEVNCSESRLLLWASGAWCMDRCEASPEASSARTEGWTLFAVSSTRVECNLLSTFPRLVEPCLSVGWMHVLWKSLCFCGTVGILLCMLHGKATPHANVSAPKKK